MFEENISQEFRLKNIDETTNYLIEQRNRNELMSKKHKKVSISGFSFLVDIPIRITSSAI